MEIIDTQAHTNCLGADWDKVAPEVLVERTVVAMEAIGIHALLIDEFTALDEQKRLLPGNVLPNGAMRSTAIYSEAAVRMYPGRFAYIGRVDPQDPDAERLIAQMRRKPGIVALRAVVLPGSKDVALLESGGYDRYFSVAAALGFPVFCMAIGQTPKAIEPFVKRHPNLQFILDHCGTWTHAPKGMTRTAQLPGVLAMAQYPNVALKWCHAPRNLTVQEYPYPDAIEHLKGAIAAFGAERIMWACDTTASSEHHSWAQGLFYILDSDRLSQLEKEWILGRAARKVLNWPKPA